MNGTRRPHGAVAVDMGASSIRYAEGWIESGRLQYRVIEQMSHQILETDRGHEWDQNKFTSIAKRALQFATEHFERGTIAIDAWGVDHGFIQDSGEKQSRLVAYRDVSHERVFQETRDQHRKLFDLTGIQPAPYNTVFQLIARYRENPELRETSRWFLLPEYLGACLGGEPGHELTHASTTQLMGVDGKWCPEVFDLFDLPRPTRQPQIPGQVTGQLNSRIGLVRVGGHDTACALLGLSGPTNNALQINLGTWSLAMTTQDKPVINDQTYALGFTNERAVDGRIRLTKNLPGFFVINLLHQELNVKISVSEWLDRCEAETSDEIDLSHQTLFNPKSMVEACSKLIKKAPETASGWAHLARKSLAASIARQPEEIALATGKDTVTSLRIGGGGSQCATLCQEIANLTGLPVYAGPKECTLLGNLAMQLRAQGVIASDDEMFDILHRSSEIKTFEPEKSQHSQSDK